MFPKSISVALAATAISTALYLSSAWPAVAHYVGEDDPTLKMDVYAVAVHNLREKCLGGDDEACVRMSYITNILFTKKHSPAPSSDDAQSIPQQPTNCATIYDHGMSFTRCY